MSIHDIIIIGGGVVGTAIARELSRYKLNITLIEKEEELAFGVSKSNSGIIHPGTQIAPHLLKGKLCVRGNKMTRRIAQELGVDFKEVGELIVIFKNEDIQKLNNLKKQAEMLGVPRLQIVSQQWLQKHEPNLSHDVVAALYAPTAGIISPYRWVYDFAENALRNGVELYTGTIVENITTHPIHTKNKNYFEIQTSRGVFKSHFLINAAGLYADDVARMMGINDFTIRPRKGEEFLLDKKKEYLTNHLIFPLPTPRSKGVLIIKTSDGNPMIGPTAEDVDDKRNVATSDNGFKKVISSVRRMVPTINENDIIAYFAGLRPVAGDDFIIRHEDSVPGCITIAGIQSPGLTAAPAIASMTVDLLRKNQCVLKKKVSFHRNRQKSTHLFAIPLHKTKKLIKKEKGYGDIVCRCEMVSYKEIHDAIARGATTMDGIKFRTRAQAGRCHGSFCTTRIMKILSEKTKTPISKITKRGRGSEIILKDPCHD